MYSKQLTQKNEKYKNAKVLLGNILIECTRTKDSIKSLRERCIDYTYECLLKNTSDFPLSIKKLCFHSLL